MPNRLSNVDEKFSYGVAELKARTDLSPGFLRAEIKAGRLPARRAGRRVLILQRDWNAYVEKFWPSFAPEATRNGQKMYATKD
jgi:hypothetical protein